MYSKRLVKLKAFLFILFVSHSCFAQNSPFCIWGTGLDGSVYQKLAIYTDTENGVLFDAAKNSSGGNLDISFNWRGGGIPPLFIRGSDANVGIGTSTPWEKFHVNGTLGIGTWTSNPQSGLQIQYTDVDGSGTSSFKHSRWSSGFYFKRNSSLGERLQLYIGGASNHVMEIYNDNNEPKIRFHTSEDSYITGGNLAIGTTNSQGYRLAVKGKAVAEEVVVKLQGNWPDYVFDKQYKLPSLSELEQFILANNHLPEVPTAEEVNENGLTVGVMHAILLKKVEELTLHLIAQNKSIEVLQMEVERLRDSKINKK